MFLKDQPSMKEVAKIFIVGEPYIHIYSCPLESVNLHRCPGLALRSYIADGDGQKRRTCFGHELSRRVCMAANRHRTHNRHRLLKFMHPERVKDYDMRSKQRGLQHQRELIHRAREFAPREADLKLSAKQWSCHDDHDDSDYQQQLLRSLIHFRFIYGRCAIHKLFKQSYL